MIKKSIFYLGGFFLLVRLTGIILTLNLMPVQDPDMISKEEFIAIQKQFSIHYELGSFLIICSNFILVFFLLFLIYLFVSEKIKPS